MSNITKTILKYTPNRFVTVCPYCEIENYESEKYCYICNSKLFPQDDFFNVDLGVYYADSYFKRIEPKIRFGRGIVPEKPIKLTPERNGIFKNIIKFIGFLMASIALIVVVLMVSALLIYVLSFFIG